MSPTKRKKVMTELEQNHCFFDQTDESNAVVIIILTTPYTWAKRHGPKTLSDWRKNNGRPEDLSGKVSNMASHLG